MAKTLCGSVPGRARPAREAALAVPQRRRLEHRGVRCPLRLTTVARWEKPLATLARGLLAPQ